MASVVPLRALEKASHPRRPHKLGSAYEVMLGEPCRSSSCRDIHEAITSRLNSP